MATILIVDDEYLIADILGYALEDEGYHIVKAINGKKGLESFVRDRPSLVITDFMMPIMDGMEFAKCIREQKTNHSVPIILMSGAQGSIGRDNRGLFDEVFDKPFDIEKVIELVHRLAPVDSHE